MILWNKSQWEYCSNLTDGQANPETARQLLQLTKGDCVSPTNSESSDRQMGRVIIHVFPA